MGRLKEIELRLGAIAKELESADADVEALSKETDALLEEKRNLEALAEQRSKTLYKLAGGNFGRIAEDPEEKKENEERNIQDAPEYRSAFLKNLQGKKLNEAEH